MKATKIIGTTLTVLALLSLAGCGDNNSQNNASGKQSSSATSTKQAAVLVVGTYQNSSKGSAVQLNSNGTGRYVYADPVNSDTNDQLTWKKTGNNEYTLNFADSDVTSPITARLSGNQLTLTGDSNWATDTLTKTTRQLNLDQFLAKKHDSGNESSSSQSNSSADPRRVGAMLFQYTYQGMPGRETFTCTQNGDSYTFSEGNDSASGITFKVKGDTVRYSVGGSADQKTISIGTLQSQTDAAQIDGMMQNVH